MSEFPSSSSPRLRRILELALFVRIAAAVAVESYVRRGGSGRVCIFPDAEYYWALAGTIRLGTPYEVIEWGDIPHFALRTPGYPAFLAGCQVLLGAQPLGARLVQAGLGTLSVWLVYRLTREVLGGTEPGRPRWSVPMAAAALAAVHPYVIVMSALIISEAVFVPLMLVALWGLAKIWNGTWAGAGRGTLLALSTGAAGGAAVLVRPSWALFLPVVLVTLCWVQMRSHQRIVVPTIGLAAAIVLGTMLVMAPWWVRNARVLGRFVPTAVWMGASLYDGLNPEATGASNMDFLWRPEFWPLDELDQDQRLRQRALEFAHENPGRALALAIIKLGRFWSPWPNAEGIRSLPLALCSVVVTLPLFALMAMGLWSRRRDLGAWALLAGPLLYFCALHLAFASSMRYRIPGEVPALGLAALGLVRTRTREGEGAPPAGWSAEPGHDAARREPRPPIA
jgi:4-amino-4-deoxy-L-arabinose transferase-like glycosyltransferase